MKTTIDIADSLFEEAKQTAKERGVTMRQLVEQGLRWAVTENRRERPPFRLRDGSVDGEGLATDATWLDIRKLIYDGRGE